MNDFTKEELFFIHSAMNIVKKSLPPQANFILLDKIQSMIDNYCEHANTGCLGEFPVYQCDNCGETVDE